jgi:uncharacterized protein (TIGR00255 family)
MNSMTGHGQAKASFDGRQLTAELSSVNRKQIEIVIALPRPLAELESRLRDEISAAIFRGRVNVSVTLHESRGTTSKQAPINLAAAEAYYQQLKKLRKKLGIKEAITLEAVLRGPGITSDTAEAPDAMSIWPHLRKATRDALRQLLAMRKKEGTSLARDCSGRLGAIAHDADRIAKLAPAVAVRYREALHERIRKAGLEIDLADERLLKEVTLYADRSDITEELTRLNSHFQQFRSLVAKDEPVGRTLDFLIQEMNREVNTIGSKANDQAISRAVVDMKTGLEKIREQVQNIE